MLKVLFITSSASSTGRSNVGDRVILAGVKNLVASAFGHYVYKEAGRWSQYSGEPDEFDLIVYAGMPQYSIRGEPGAEEKHFQSLIDASKRAVFMNIGGGTIHGLSSWTPVEATRMALAKGARYYRRQEKRIAYRSVRDKTCKLFFSLIGASAKLRCCPSYFSTLLVRPETSRPGAIAAISNQNFVTNQFHGDMQALIAGFHDRWPSFDLVAHSGTDLGMLADLGRQHIYFKSEDALLSYYATVQKLIAMRVHAAIPAWTCGADVVVGGFDNRIGMFDDIGMPVPWIRMVNRPTEDIRAEFEQTLLDKSKHAPLAERRRLIEAQLKKMTSEVRDSAPSLLDKSSTKAVELEGWGAYPPPGTIEKGTDGYKLFPLAEEPRSDAKAAVGGIVQIAPGARAASASKTVDFPLAIEAQTFSFGTLPKSKAKQQSGKIRSEVVAVSRPLYLPSGAFAFGCSVQVSGDTSSSDGALIEITQGNKVLKTATLSANDLRDDVKTSFSNEHPAMPITVSVCLPRRTDRSHGLNNVTISRFDGSATPVKPPIKVLNRQ